MLLDIVALSAQVSLFHFAAFAAGHRLAKETIAKAPDDEGLARCISLETGMQVSLQGSKSRSH